MSTVQPTRSCERLIPDEGPVLLFPDVPGEEQWGLLLDVNVCPFPGCPERHVIVDGFLVEHLRRSLVRPGRGGASDDAPPEGEPDWAFAVSIDVDEPGEVHVEKCADPVALRWFETALDAELRAAFRRRFELHRARFDAALGDEGGVPPGGPAVANAPSGWRAAALTPDQAAAVLASLERSAREGRLPGGVWVRRGPVRAERIGRNDPCPCGSGRKYKRCCLGSA